MNRSTELIESSPAEYTGGVPATSYSRDTERLEFRSRRVRFALLDLDKGANVQYMLADISSTSQEKRDCLVFQERNQ